MTTTAAAAHGVPTAGIVPVHGPAAGAADTSSARVDPQAHPQADPRPRKQRLLRWLPRRWVLTAGTRSRRVLYLTFDDGPDPEHTPAMLDLLARHGVRATFFLLGQQVERHPDLAARIVAEGHAIANHSWDHPRVERLTLAQQRDQVDRTDALLARFDGRARHDFRPPRGAMPAGMVLDCIRRGIRIAYWSFDTLDYSHRPPAELAALARADGLRPGDVLLLHDDSTHSHGLLEILIPEWKAQGYAFEALPAATRAGVA